MNNREKLTTTSIRRYRDNHMMGERLRKWDSEVPGLFLRISPRGSAAYAVKIKRVDGSKAEATLGHVDKIALDQARRMAKAEFAKEAKGEPDLVTRRRQERLEAQQLKAQTLESLFDRYIEHLQKKGCGVRYMKDTRLTFDTHIIPALGKHPFREITRGEIETVVRETQKRAAKHRRSSPEDEGRAGYRKAKLVHSHLKAMFKWASRQDDTLWGWNPADINMREFNKPPTKRPLMSPAVLEAMLEALGSPHRGVCKTEVGTKRPYHCPRCSDSTEA